MRQRGVIAADAAPETITRAVQRFQLELGDRYLMYLNDAADHGIVAPGVRERAMIMGETRPGSLGWMLKRAFIQFKMWPLAAINQIIGREIAYTLVAKGQEATPWNRAAALALNPNVYWLLALSKIGRAHV